VKGRPFDPAGIGRALDVAEGWVHDGVVPGIAACVVTAEGGVAAERYAGVLERGSEAPVDERSLFALASLTKPLVAAACMVAVEEGLLDLDDEVRDGFALRHLLSHCSGLPEGTDNADAALVEPPATRRRYTNAGYELAGRLLSDAAGMPAARYLHEAVIEPLGLDASLGLAPADAARTATVREPGLLAPGEPLFNSPRFRAAAHAASGGFASARAYAAFLHCLLLRGRAPGGALLAAETVDEMLATQFGELPGGVALVAQWDACPWGLGFDVRGTRQPHWAGGSVSPSANTHFGASGTLAWLDRERGIGLVALANRGSYSGWAMRSGGWSTLSDAVVEASMSTSA
jgi:CubicO group peptidase (beta-lactamase class C family)